MKIENAVIAAVILLMVVGIGACERARWRECRRIHPFWYCFDNVVREK